MQSDLYVVGGGLAGLAAASLAARRGLRVTLFERSQHLGGRARSRVEDGDTFNLGPHALYAGGVAHEVLTELGVPVSARRPDASGMLALREGRAHALPVGGLSLLSTGLLTLPDKLALGELLTKLPRRDLEADRGRRLSEVVAELAPRPRVAAVLLALVRLSTYANDPGATDARLALLQTLRGAESGVLYVDGGWQSLVAGLEAAARGAGVTIETGATVETRRVLGEVPVIVATPPQAAAKLLGSRFEVTPVKAACLDLALSEAPRPRRWFGLGIDEPVYVSVHSRFAALSASGRAVVHGMRVPQPGEAVDGARDRRAIEAALDRVQPGWRERVVSERFYPSLTVSHALPGPRPRIDQGNRTYLAGDWVDGDHLLADGALDTARRAVGLATGTAAEAGWAA